MGRTVRLQFYGRLRDAAGAPMRESIVPDVVRTAEDLIAWIARDDAMLGEALVMPSVKIAAGDAIIPRDADIRQAAEIAFLPPFSGG